VPAPSETNITATADNAAFSTALLAKETTLSPFTLDAAPIPDAEAGAEGSTSETQQVESVSPAEAHKALDAESEGESAAYVEDSIIESAPHPGGRPPVVNWKM
jgi:hypothetical protein